MFSSLILFFSKPSKEHTKDMLCILIEAGIEERRIVTVTLIINTSIIIQ